MISISIKFDKKLSTWVKQVREGLGPLLEKVTEDTATYGKGLIIRSTAKGRTGKAHAMWDKVREGVARWKIFNRLLYVKFLETGTGLYGPLKHLIYPVTAKFMRWPNYSGRASGNKVQSYSYAAFTKGMPAQPAIEPNVAAIQKDLNQRFKNYIRRLFKATRAEAM